jgi:nitrogen regulatory protein PII
MTQTANRLVIITERLLEKKVTAIIEAAGASGYTVVAADGKGSRNVRSTGQPMVSHGAANIRIEVITSDPELGRRIADQVAEKYFDDYSGIVFMDQVEILRAHKF